MRAILEPWEPEAVVISAEKGWGLDELRARVEVVLAEEAAGRV